MRQSSCGLLAFLLILSVSVAAQKNKSDVKDEAKVKDIVAFLEYMLNTLGNKDTHASDKDVLIKESYSKIFRDDKVQIEDDLDENRKVITNKDVVAYLKDVDFFYSDVKFEFTIDNIQGETNANGTYFYKVTTRRNLKGTTSDGKAVNNTIPRYIEINYNPKDDDLKIVSIYTREFNEKEALTKWWNALSYEWHAIFRRKLNLTDSVQLNDIKNMASIQELDLSRNQYIQSIEPLSLLTSMKSLDLAHTNITDLTAIRNLADLVKLNVSNTLVEDLSPLKYSSNITALDISHTLVSNLEVLEKMQKLQVLDISHTPVVDFTPLAGLDELTVLNLGATQFSDLSAVSHMKQLAELNLSRTLVNDLSPMSGLKEMKSLNLDSTRIQNIGPLSTLENLTVLSANHTQLENLQPLLKLPALQKVYCDQTRITKMVAENFMSARPKTLVVYDSKDLQVWWNTLPAQWQDVFSQTASIGLSPTKEELARITTIDSINLRDKYSIFDLEPLRKLPMLKSLVLDKTAVHDLSPIRDHREIRYLDVSNTETRDLSVVSQFSKLEELRADNSKVEDISPLYNLNSLKRLYVDQTLIHDILAQEFLARNPRCLIIYKTNHLSRWWSNISERWKNLFREQMTGDTTATRENLHRVVEQETLRFNDVPVSDLSALTEFVRLKELHFSGTAITDLKPLAHLKSLRSLHATRSPVQNIEALEQLTELEDLDISNTPVADLKVVGKLDNLRKLNCSGTQIKKLDPLDNLSQLEELDCSNTFVNKLDDIEHLPLLLLKCYNTRISNRTVEKFRNNKPDCEVIYYR